MRERKSNYMPIKLSRREKLALIQLSDAKGESMAAVIRALIRAEAERLDCWPTASDALTDGLGFMPRPETRRASPKELAELEAAAEAEGRMA